MSGEPVTPAKMRAMGETESSIAYAFRESDFLRVFGEALDPRAVTMEAAVAAMRLPPATDTGD